jgi:hypothetical protein
MTKSKKDLVEEILSIKEVDTKANLMKKTIPQLEKILKDLKAQNQNDAVAMPQVDMEALIKQLREQIKEELRKEMEAEVVSTDTSVDYESESSKLRQKREIDRFEPIPVMNVTNGQLVYHSKRTGAEWVWSKYGDIEYIEFQELLTMRSSQRRFLDEPFIIILDDDAVEHLGLRKMYESFSKISVDKIDEVFKLRQEDFEDVIEKAPRGIKHLIISRAREKYADRSLDSVMKIRFINEKFNLDIGQRG